MGGASGVETQADWFAVLAFAGVLLLTLGLYGMRARSALVLVVSAIGLVLVSVAGTVLHLVGAVLWVPLGIAGLVMFVRRARYASPPAVSGIAPAPGSCPPEDGDARR